MLLCKYTMQPNVVKYVFVNVTTFVTNQSTTTTHTTQPASPTPPPAITTQPQLQSQEAEHTASPETAVPSMGEDGMKIGPSGAQGKEKVEEAGLESEVTTAATRSEPVNVKEERKEKDGPPSKRARLQLPESTGGFEFKWAHCDVPFCYCYVLIYFD